MNEILKKGAQLHRQRKALEQREEERDSSSATEQVANATVATTKSKPTLTLQDALLEQELSSEDLYEAPKNMHSDYLLEEFQTSFSKYKKEMETAMNDLTSKGQIDEEKLTELRNKGRSRLLMKVLWVLAKPSYIPAGMYQFVTVIVQTMSPLVVQQLLIQFEEHEHQSILSATGIILAFVLFFCSMADGIAQERHKFLAFQAGITIRAATVNAIYDQMLKLSAKGKESLLTGETTNLVAIECQKLFEVTQEGHLSEFKVFC